MSAKRIRDPHAELERITVRLMEISYGIKDGELRAALVDLVRRMARAIDDLPAN